MSVDIQTRLKVQVNPVHTWKTTKSSGGVGTEYFSIRSYIWKTMFASACSGSICSTRTIHVVHKLILHLSIQGAAKTTPSPV